jgi:hypothetical protein
LGAPNFSARRSRLTVFLMDLRRSSTLIHIPAGAGLFWRSRRDDSRRASSSPDAGVEPDPAPYVAKSQAFA